MNLSSKPNLILTSVAIAAHMVFAGAALAQTDTSLVGPEQVVIAADTVPDEMAAKPLPLSDQFVPYISEDLIADRLGCLQNEINLEYNRTIQSFIEFFVVRRRDYTKMVLGRTDLYFPIFEEYLKKYNMPPELKYLSVVESGLNPTIVSRAKAGGLWQFMPGTGRDFRLYQDAYIDERFDPYKSTEAACKYLKQLYNLFGDWELALASYNCGPGNVRRAIRRSGNRTTFWEIYNYLPRETRSYVPQFVALTYVLNYAEDYKLKADTFEKIIPFDTIQVSQHVNMEALAKQIDTPLEDLRLLNPHIKRNLVPPYLKNYPVRIPSDKHELFSNNRAAILDSVSKAQPLEVRLLLTSAEADYASSQVVRKKISHTVRRGESIDRIADKFNVKVSQLKHWNRVRGNKLRAGQRLTIWVEKRVPVHHKPVSVNENKTVAKVDTVAEASGENVSGNVEATVAPVEKKASHRVEKKVFHTVRRGESLSRIADKYNVTMANLKEWNHLKSQNVRTGQKLTVGVHHVATEEKKVAKAEKNVQEALTASTQSTAGPAEETPESQQHSEDKVIHTVQKGESLFRIAQKYHVSSEQIKVWNQLTSTSLKYGQQLVIWKANAPEASTTEVSDEAPTNTSASHSKKVSSAEKSSEHSESAVSEKEDTQPNTPTNNKTDALPKFHLVQKGDTLWSISRQYGNIPVEKLKKLNNLKGNEVKAGMKIILG